MLKTLGQYSLLDEDSIRTYIGCFIHSYQTTVSTCAIKSRGLYIFYPIFQCGKKSKSNTKIVLEVSTVFPLKRVKTLFQIIPAILIHTLGAEMFGMSDFCQPF